MPAEVLIFDKLTSPEYTFHSLGLEDLRAVKRNEKGDFFSPSKYKKRQMNEAQALTRGRSVQQSGSRTSQWWSLRKCGILGSAGWPARARLHFLPPCHQRCEHREGWERRCSGHILDMQEERIPFDPLFTSWYRRQADWPQPVYYKLKDTHNFNDFSFAAGGSGANLLISPFKLHIGWLQLTNTLELNSFALAVLAVKIINIVSGTLLFDQTALQGWRFSTCTTDDQVCVSPWQGSASGIPWTPSNQRWFHCRTHNPGWGVTQGAAKKKS